MDKVWASVKELLASKKFLAALLSLVLYGLGKVGLDLTLEQVLPVLAPLWAYIFGQGLADFGKSKAVTEAASVEKAVEALKKDPLS